MATQFEQPSVSPWGPCGDCLQDKTCTQRERNTGIIATWCRHNRSGALWFPDLGCWKIHIPVEKAYFLAAVDQAIKERLQDAKPKMH